MSTRKQRRNREVRRASDPRMPDPKTYSPETLRNQGLGTERAVIADLDGVFFQLLDHFGERGVAARLPNEVKIADGLTGELDKLVAMGFTIIGVTNQPDIARDKITPAFLEWKHRQLKGKYPQFKAIFPCTHTEADLCDCRKPKPGLLRQAAKKFNLDLPRCWMIGDSRADVEAGMMVGAETIFIQTQWNCGNPAIDKATAVATSTRGALKLIAQVESGERNTGDA